MRLTRLSRDEASTLAVRTIGLDAASIDLTSLEFLCATLRRAASFMCPTSPSRLVEAVLETIRPLQGADVGREEIAEALDLLIGSGDLLELRHESSGSPRLLYLAPPSYIERVPGTYLLMGVRPYGARLIEDDLAEVIDYEGHARILILDSENADDKLSQLGLQAVLKDRWVACPAVADAADFVGEYKMRIDVAREVGELDGLAILDPASPARYYRGRWRSPVPRDTGDFVARRPQAYGADLWCLVRFAEGKPQRLIEFPVDDSIIPGCHEAWRYQAAVDAVRGQPQRFRFRATATTEPDAIIDFFSPLPGFAERYVQFVGLPLGKTRGALFSYRVPTDAARDIATFLSDMLWMVQEEVHGDI